MNLLLLSKDKPNFHLETDKKNDNTLSLLINNVITSDEAIYYCINRDLTVSQHLKGSVRKSSYPCSLASLTVLKSPMAFNALIHGFTGIRTGYIIGT